MGANFLVNYYEVVAIILFCIGFTTLFLDRNLVKKIIGLNIADAGIYLFIVAKGYIAGRAAPLITDGVIDADRYVNPIPTGLILTGIVISVSLTAVALAVIVSLYKRYPTLDLDEIIRLAALEEEP